MFQIFMTDSHLLLKSNLEGGEEEVREEPGETQADAATGGLICCEDKDHIMDPEQRDQS